MAREPPHNRRTAVGHYIRSVPVSLGQRDQLGDPSLATGARSPHEPLMPAGSRCGHGRNDYPRPMNSLIAACVFQHPSIAALRRELLRNGQLRDSCGSPVRGRGSGADRMRLYPVPAPAAQVSATDRGAVRTLDELQIEVPDLGQVQALDGRSCIPWPRAKAAIRCRRMTPSKTPTGAATGMPIGASRARARRNATGTATCCTWWWMPPTSCRAFELTEASRQPQAQLRIQERHPELLGAVV